MNLKIYLFILFTLILQISPLKAQNGPGASGDRLGGIILDAQTREPIAGAGIRLKNKADTTDVQGHQSDERGMFRFSNLKAENYILEVIYLGYHTHRIEVSPKADRPFYRIELKSQSTSLKTITVEEKAPLSIQKKDTTEYNANAYKVHKDANTEDLITKMPGITNDNGTVKAHGEEVKKVLLDGKPFFGDDPNAALKNLPAEVVEKVQVFDQLSDQSQFTGFNDGNTNKTMNIVTRPNKRNGLIAKIYGGYGKDEDMKTDRYQSGLNINKFKGDQRITILGMFNNVNQQNFNIQDLFGMMGGGNPQMQRMGQIGNAMGMSPGMMFRGGGGGGPDGGVGNFMVGQQNGISKTLAGGLNYNDKYFNRLQVSLSYFYNNSNNQNDQLTNRKYILQNDSNMLYYKGDTSTTNNLNHRLNARLEFTIDSFNSILMTPRLTFQDNGVNSLSDATTTKLSENLNASLSKTNSSNIGYNFNNDLLLRHKFLKLGRTISLNINTALNERNSSSNLYSTNVFNNTDSTVMYKNVNQRAKTDNAGSTWGTTLSYTEQLSEKQQLQFTYNLNNTINSNDKNTFKFDSIASDYIKKDSLLSNTYKNEYLTNRGGISYRYVTPNINLSLDANYQLAHLSGYMTQPMNSSVSKDFNNFLPAVQIQYTFQNKSSLRFNYRTSTNAPSAGQMQPVIDNSNPLSINKGNPDLRQQYSHNVFMRYNYSNPIKANSFFVFLNYNEMLDYIGNSTTINSKTGSQFITYENLNGYRMLNSFVSYGLPIKKIKSVLNMNLGVNYSHTPSRINGQDNFSEATTFISGFVLSSNISEKLDFTIGFTPSYSISQNTIQKSLNNNYYYQNSSFKLNWYVLPKTFINTEVREMLYAGLSSSYNQQFTLWSGSIGQKFGPMQAAEIKFTVFDILHQNNAISRNISDTYIEDVKSLVLQRYFMITLSFNFRKFKQ